LIDSIEEVTFELRKSKKWFKRWKSFSPKAPRIPTFLDGKDIYLKDVDGNLYMDFATQSTNVGIKNPRIVDAVKAQLDRTGVSIIRGPYIPKVELMEKILKIIPNCLREGKFEFCNTGSDASEFTMQLVRSFTGKQILIAYLGGHYGLSIGTLSLIADRSENRRFCLPLIPGIIHIPYPYCYRCSFGKEYPGCDLQCLHYLEYLFDTVAHPDEVAAIFVEPMQQVGGVIAPPKDYFPKLRKICVTNEILFVDDEVATGFGRTGKMF
jgi:4-aminobutyrate aminotransferase